VIPYGCSGVPAIATKDHVSAAVGIQDQLGAGASATVDIDHAAVSGGVRGLKAGLPDQPE
jgi:hypothetical protein